MYIIAVEKETGSTEVLKNGEDFATFGNEETDHRETLESGLKHAAEKYGANNISCFKKVKITFKTEAAFIEE